MLCWMPGYKYIGLENIFKLMFFVDMYFVDIPFTHKIVFEYEMQLLLFFMDSKNKYSLS